MNTEPRLFTMVEPRLFTAVVYYRGRLHTPSKGRVSRAFSARRALVIMAADEDATRTRAIAWFVERVKRETAFAEFGDGTHDALVNTLALDDTVVPSGVFVEAGELVDVVPMQI